MFHPKKQILTALLSFFLFIGAFANTSKDSAQKVIADIDRAYTDGRISKKIYLDSVYSTMRSFLSERIFFTNKEAITLLSLYRKTIWEDDKNFTIDEKYNHKRKYYGILANQAQMVSRMGENLYYGEKIERLEQNIYHRPSLTALSIIAGYYEIHRAPQKIIAVYQKAKDYIDRTPALGEKDSLDANNLVQAIIILEHVTGAYYELNQLKEGQATEALIKKLIAVIRQKYAQNESVVCYAAYLQNLAAIKGAAANNNADFEQQQIKALEARLNNPQTPEYIKNYIYNDLINRKIDFFFRHYQPDSLAHYLDIDEQLVRDEGQPYNLFLHAQSRAKELYLKGHYKASADTLDRAIALLDSSRSDVVKDVDDMLYAQAEAEEKQWLLTEAEIRQKKIEKNLMLTGLITGVLLLGGIFIIRYTRHRQQTRFLQFKFNLARNLHDETSPALLYAKALARAQRSNGEGRSNELEQHIDHTMALIRSLSHDLRSDKQYTIASLINYTEDLLRKLNTDNSFTYTVSKPADTKRFISHYQYTELKAVLNECITNTIKHANFTKINVTFERANNQLTILYKDDGCGWETFDNSTGIGIKNIQERCTGLNGECKIVNNYPNGYYIQISILLR